MSDKKRIDGGMEDGGYDRDLAVASRAYRNANAELPPPAMDDAIRAAARVAVKSGPRVIGKSWASRWSAPLSAAALVVLTVSVGFFAIEEKPELAPAALTEMVKAKSAPPAASVSAPQRAPESPAPVMPPTMAPAEKKLAQLQERQRGATREQLAKTVNPDLAQRRNEAAIASGIIVTKETKVTVGPAVPATAPAPSPAAPSKAAASEAPAFVADPYIAAPGQGKTIVADRAKREATQAKQFDSQLAAGAIRERSDAAPAVVQEVRPATSATAPAAATRAAPSVYAAPAPPVLADKSADTPEVWLKRIVELKREGKAREAEVELAKFRKRYPDFKLPNELKTDK